MADERLRDAERALAAATAAVKAADKLEGVTFEAKADALCAALEEQGQALRRVNIERRRAGLPVLLRRCDRSKRSTPRRPADEDELAMAAALARCSFTPGSWDKRFARDVAAQLRATAYITQRQAESLRQMVHRYRRQLPPEVVALGQRPAPQAEPDQATETGPMFGAP